MSMSDTIGAVKVGYAPARICDIGGWTDTWFAKHGAVLNFAVHPGVRVKMRKTGGKETYIWMDRTTVAWLLATSGEGGNELVNAVLRDAGVAKDGWFIQITCGLPVGVGLGTSAALLVAILRALGERDPEVLWRKAHKIESGYVGRETGIQDHIAAAYAGVQYIQCDYPDAQVHRLSNAMMPDGLMHLYVGGNAPSEDSSDVHKRIIAEVNTGNPLATSSRSSQALQWLAELPGVARVDLLDKDYFAFAAAMNCNQHYQHRLTKSVPDVTRASLEEYGVIGTKTNGSGGSLCVLLSRPCAEPVALDAKMARYNYRRVPFEFAGGDDATEA
jgi:D-glycero-alpha-D-manno-heptose-7-phosphate kinase